MVQGTSVTDLFIPSSTRISKGFNVLHSEAPRIYYYKYFFKASGINGTNGLRIHSSTAFFTFSSLIKEM